MSESERDTLTGLLSVDPELRRSRLAWLRDYSESPAPTNIVALLDRLEYARGLGIDAARAGRIHATRLARLVDEGVILSVPHIAELEPARRTAILVIQAVSLETRLADATLAMFEKYMGTLFSRARNRDERRFQATRRDVAKALILFRRTIAALRRAKEAGEDGVAVVEREIGMKQLDGVLPIIGAVADVADQDILVTAAERYSVLRRFSPRFLAAFDFRSNTPNDPVLAAVELLRAMDRDGTRVLPKRPPSSFLSPQWRKLIFASARRTGAFTKRQCWQRCASVSGAATSGLLAAATIGRSRTTCCRSKPGGTSASTARPIPDVTSPAARRRCASA